LLFFQIILDVRTHFRALTFVLMTRVNYTIFHGFVLFITYLSV